VVGERGRGREGVEGTDKGGIDEQSRIHRILRSDIYALRSMRQKTRAER
jgi:hypothetical protein